MAQFSRSIVCALLIIIAVSTATALHIVPEKVVVVAENKITRQSEIFKKATPYKATVRDDDQIINEEGCTLEPTLITEIQGYQSIVDRIVLAARDGFFKGQTFGKMRDFVDKFGPRVSGSKELEDSIDYLMEEMRAQGLQNVHGEEVVVPHYIRGEEQAQLLAPRVKNLALLGLVPSVGTPAEGITAEVFVTTSFDHLNQNAARARGKIVVFNQGWLGTYGSTVSYRSQGAIAAARAGAVAVLIQSIADFSLDTPHTGGMSYADDAPQIPSACITEEDSKLLWRLQEQGDTLRIHLKMLSYKMPPTTSRNVIGEITGRQFQDQFVGVSGHIDSWDVGSGAMDDAGGVYISAGALYLLKGLINDTTNPLQTPRRTLQAIAWTSEEVGLVGVEDYVNKHLADLSKFSAIFESDGGVWTPTGLEVGGNKTAGCIVFEILKLFQAYNMDAYSRGRSVSSDISMLIEQGVPGVSLKHANDNYFWYHHTQADVVDVLDTNEMDLATGLWAASSYIIADLLDPLPRGGEAVPLSRSASQEWPGTV